MKNDKTPEDFCLNASLKANYENNQIFKKQYAFSSLLQKEAVKGVAKEKSIKDVINSKLENTSVGKHL